MYARFPSLLVVLAASALLSGCIIVPKKEYVGGKAGENLDRYLALHEVRTAPAFVLDPGAMLSRHAAMAWQLDATGYHGGAPGVGKAVDCPYALTPAPVATKSLILLYFFIPIPPPSPGQGTRDIKVACDDSKSETFQVNGDRSNAFIDAWHRLSLPDTGAADRAAFAALAVQYRALAEKPALPESVREHKIAAEKAVRDKNYADAIREYNAGLAANPAWPQAWFNKAMIYAELDVPEGAIDAMEHYLLLVPDAENARQAQDKIYEWKALLAHAGSPG